MMGEIARGRKWHSSREKRRRRRKEMKRMRGPSDPGKGNEWTSNQSNAMKIFFIQFKINSQSFIHHHITN
jgi:hypothetical protein